MTMIDNVQNLLKKTMKTYEMAQRVGVPVQTLRDLRNGRTSLENVRFNTIRVLNDYYEQHYLITNPYENLMIEIDHELIDDEQTELLHEFRLTEQLNSTVRILRHHGLIYEYTYEIENLVEESAFFGLQEHALGYAQSQHPTDIAIDDTLTVLTGNK